MPSAQLKSPHFSNAMLDEKIQKLHNSTAILLDDNIPTDHQYFTDFCNAARGTLTQAQLHNRKPSIMFNDLETAGKIGVGNYEILVSILETAKLIQLKEIVLARQEEIKRLLKISDMTGAACSSSSSISHSGGVQPLNKNTKHKVFKIIQNSAACKDWPSLGRELGVKESDIEAISSDYSRDIKEQCYQMLKTWNKAQSATGDTHVLLMDALSGINCVSVAEEIEQILQ